MVDGPPRGVGAELKEKWYREFIFESILGKIVPSALQRGTIQRYVTLRHLEEAPRGGVAGCVDDSECALPAVTLAERVAMTH
jgi:hypothetical protein